MELTTEQYQQAANDMGKAIGIGAERRKYIRSKESETAIAAAFYAMASGISEEVTDSILSEEEGNNIILRMRLHMIQESRGEKEQEYVETIDNAKKEIDLHSQAMVLLSETMKQYCDNAQSESNRRIAQLESQIKELSRENEEIRRVPQGEVTSEGYMQTQMISHTETAGHRTFAGLFSGRRKKTDDISEENRRYREEKRMQDYQAFRTEVLLSSDYSEEQKMFLAACFKEGETYEKLKATIASPLMSVEMMREMKGVV